MRALILDMFDRGIEIESIARQLKLTTTAVRIVVWTYRRMTS